MARIHHDPVFVLHRLYAHHNLHGTANEKENQHVIKRTILKGMVRFYIYRMKNQDITSKIGLYRRKSAIYHQKSDYIGEKQDISSKIGLYLRKTAIYQRNLNYIDETPLNNKVDKTLTCNLYCYM